ncbi:MULTISPECIES: hypothetical protein [unclassified Inquilinus]|uniref:hypothetical protein n=1 Tax=unclassified Inquilinus TaxID=2645927 RepID=UPI003F93671E
MTAPFGIPIYSPINSLKITSELGFGKYLIIPPTPHPLFSQYIVQASEAHGVVWLKGISADIENDVFGNATKELIDRVATQLSQRYGQGKKTDMLFEGSIWNEPRDWISGLEQHERIYMYMWDRAQNTQIPSDISSIGLLATSFQSGSSAAALEYSSPKLEDAQQGVETDMASLL